MKRFQAWLARKEKFEVLVDRFRSVLHNLVSLLLMQRRKTEVDVVLAMCSLKTNSR
ncbi:hypothetical protein [Caballeronia pedi]|uniref:hypothetical protein n=1 Tax=Caballeronia pedi TaxID=1777141 RepID=UPI00135C6259|nr:hypothetical protein [Caballeronia pedi]